MGLFLIENLVVIFFCGSHFCEHSNQLLFHTLQVWRANVIVLAAIVAREYNCVTSHTGAQMPFMECGKQTVVNTSPYSLTLLGTGMLVAPQCR